MRIYETDGLSYDQKQLLRSNGFFVYDIQDADDGRGYVIRNGVCCNHIGNIITDTEIVQVKEYGYINDDDYIPLISGSIEFDEIYPILKGTKNRWGSVEARFQ